MKGNPMKESMRCKHFNGAQNNCCEANIEYQSFRREGVPLFRSLPCMSDRNQTDNACALFETYTAEELAAQEAETERMLRLLEQGLSACCEVPFNTSQVITAGRHKGHGPRFCSKCGKFAYMV